MNDSTASSCDAYIEIPLSQGKVALVSPEDADRVSAFKWSALCPNPSRGKPKWYATRGDYSGQKRKAVWLHRFILDAPSGVEVDHINGDGLDCRRSNLRLATRAQNARNSKRGDSRFKGVCATKWGWKAILVADGNQYVSKSFRTEIQAALAYDELAREHHGLFAWLNFPRPGEGGGADLTAEERKALLSVDAIRPGTSRGNRDIPYRGICQLPGGRWRAMFQSSGVKRHIGVFDTPEQAAAAYDRAAIKHLGFHALVNFPESLVPLLASMIEDFESEAA
jgi:hypothetical protein